MTEEEEQDRDRLILGVRMTLVVITMILPMMIKLSRWILMQSSTEAMGIMMIFIVVKQYRHKNPSMLLKYWDYGGLFC